MRHWPAVLLAASLMGCSEDSDDSLWMVQAEADSIQRNTGCEELAGGTEAMWQSTLDAPIPPLAFAKVTGRDNAEDVADCFRNQPWASNVTMERRDDSPTSSFGRTDD